MLIVDHSVKSNPSAFKVPEAISSMFEVGYGYEKDEFGFNTNGRFQVKLRKVESHEPSSSKCSNFMTLGSRLHM